MAGPYHVGGFPTVVPDIDGLHGDSHYGASPPPPPDSLTAPARRASPKKAAMSGTPSRRLAPLAWGALVFLAITTPARAQDSTGMELPVRRVPNLGSGAEFYFSPDGTHLIGNAKPPGGSEWHVVTIATDGSDFHLVNEVGADACSFYFPDGRHIIWTSTRDHLDLPRGDYSDPRDYPQGAELYVSRPDGSERTQLTHNTQYDAEVTTSPDGQWILFSRQVDGKLDLWHMRPDGSGAVQITHTDDWQEGGALYLPDSHTILFRAWHRADEGRISPLPMAVFTIRDDGTGLHQLTPDGITSWAPYPAPDGRHFIYVRVLPPMNYELVLADLQSAEERRLTWFAGFDGFPSISPDGHWLAFTSSRTPPPGERGLHVYLMDIASLGIGPSGAGEQKPRAQAPARPPSR